MIIAGMRSHLKKPTLAQDQGGGEFQATDISEYFEDLKLAPKTEISPKDFSETAYSLNCVNGVSKRQKSPRINKRGLFLHFSVGGKGHKAAILLPWNDLSLSMPNGMNLAFFSNYRNCLKTQSALLRFPCLPNIHL